MSARKRLRSETDSDEGTVVTSCKKLALYDPAPFSSEVSPLPKRLPITIEEAKNKSNRDPVRVYADGVFDMFHNGHARALMQAKNSFPNTYLIVGVTNDELTHHYKGQTVMTEQERYDCVRHCRYVDEVFENCPWVATPEFLEKHQIDFVAHDDAPYNFGGQEDIYKPIKQLGKFVATNRTKGVSTTDLIARVVRNYDDYITRNLSRGYTAKDLNISRLKENEVRVKESLKSMKNKASQGLHKCEEKSKDLLSSFMSLFGQDGRISEFFHGAKRRVFSATWPTQPDDDDND